MAKYDAQWSSAHPGLLVILLDQSGSMVFENMQGVDETRTVFATRAVNHVIQTIINKSFAGTKPKNRAFVSVIGYNHEIKDCVSGYIQDLAASPLRLEKVEKQMLDGTGGLLTVPEEVPVWVEPVTKDGATNMKGAFEMAKELVQGWIQDHAEPLSPAPVIINISDGVPFFDGKDPKICMGETEDVVKEVMQLGNEDGKVLVFNACINEGQQVVFPTSENELPNEEGKFLFRISSEVPDGYQAGAAKSKITVKQGSRGCIYAADAINLIKLIDFGSSKGQGDFK